MKKVAVVILNWNGEKLLKEFLPSVIHHTPPEWSEIIVADNGSTDNSISLLQQQFPTVRLIRFEKNHGFAGGYNRAIDQLDHPFTVLLNSDVEVTPGWLEAPIRHLEEDISLAGAQPKIKSYRQKEMFEYAGACGGYIDTYGYPFCRGRIFQEIEKDTGQYDRPTDILWASGAALIIRTDVYKKAGGLDEKFFAHQEEIDLCWRLRILGYRFIAVPQSTVYHLGGATLAAESPHKTFLNFRNNLLMLYKNLPEQDLKRVMKRRFWLDYLAALQFFLTGKIKNAQAVHKARKEFYLLKKEFYSEIRQEIQSQRVSAVIPEILPSCLLVDFYLKSKKRFSDLVFNKRDQL